MSTKNTIHKYCRAVSSWLPCSRKQKKVILSGLRPSMEAFLKDYPGASFSDIAARFGTPQQIAAACVAEMSNEALLEQLQTKDKLFRIILYTILIILLCCLSCIGLLFLFVLIAGETPIIYI